MYKNFIRLIAMAFSFTALLTSCKKDAKDTPSPIPVKQGLDTTLFLGTWKLTSGIVQYNTMQFMSNHVAAQNGQGTRLYAGWGFNKDTLLLAGYKILIRKLTQDSLVFYITDIKAICRHIRQATPTSPYNISVIAGDYYNGNQDESLSWPNDVEQDQIGSLYVSDSWQNRIAKADAITHKISTFIGYSQPDVNVPATYVVTNTSSPSSIKLVNNNDLYITSPSNIYKYSIKDKSISNLALERSVWGFGSVFYVNGPTLATSGFDLPSAIAVNKAGDIYIADTHGVRKVSAGTGNIKLVVGNGTISPAATYSGTPIKASSTSLQVMALTLDNNGMLYISDKANSRIWKLNETDGTLESVAGKGTKGFAGDGGLAKDATLNQPWGIDIDKDNNIYIADGTNHRIRKITAADGLINSIAGNNYGSPLYIPTDNALDVGLGYPAGLRVTATGDVLFADYYNDRIFKLSLRH